SYTNLPPVVMQAATTYSMTVTAGSYSGQGFAVWIDANDDNVFSASEKVGFSTSTTSGSFGSITFNINLPCTPPLGIHRMRVRGIWLGVGSTMDPCASAGYGEAEDYLVQYIPGTPFTPTFTAAPTTQSCTYVDYTYTTQTNNQNYVWTIPGTANVDYQLVSGGTSTSNSAVIQWLVGGVKTVSVNYQNLSGCNSTGPVSNTITVQQTVQVAASTGTNTVCAGSQVTFANTTSNGTWSSANTAVATVNSTTGVVTGVGAGNTNIVYSVPNPNTWCAATTNLRPITVRPTPVVNAGSGASICAGNSTNLNATVQFNTSCTHTLVIMDSYGDGSNGGLINVIVDGVTVQTGVTLASGYGPQNVTFTASIGSVIQVVLSTPGSYPSEIYWDVLDGAGTLLVDDYYPNTTGNTWTGNGGGCAPLTPTWSPAAGLSSTTINNPVATPTATTTYVASATGANGCTGTSNIVVTVNALPANGPVVAPAALCAGSAGLVSNSVAGGAWTTTTPTLLSLNAATGEITGIAAGTATVNYTTTGSNGCTKTNTANITINPLPVAVVSSSNGAAICQGNSTVLSAPAAASYLWNNGSTASSLNISNGGTYSVVLTSAAGCVSAPSAPYTVTVNQLPVANVSVSGPTVFCAGGSVTLTASGGATYSWSNTATTAAVNANQSGSYVATVTSAQGCSVTAPAINVTVNPLPVANVVASGPLSYCQGGSLNLTATGIGSYQWNDGSTAAILPITTSGTYSYTITNAAGCSATSAPAVVTINPVPVVTAISGNNSVCMGGNTTYTNTTTGGVWSSANPSIATVNASGQITGVMAGSSVINYTVTNGAGCATVVSKTITVNPVPAAITQANGNTTFCAGGSVTLVAPPADTYLWSNNATTQSITVNTSGNYFVTATLSGCVGTSVPVAVTVSALPSTTISASSAAICTGGSSTLTVPAAATYTWSNGANTQSISVNTPGTYSVTVTNAAGCTASSAPITINAAAAPTVNVTANGPVSFCPGGNVVLNSAASAGSTYLWSNGATTPNITATTSGVYFVTVTNAAGCQTSSNNIVVNAQQTFNATATALSPTTVCQGTAVTLVATPGATYLWSNGATTQGVNVTTAGPISVTVTNASGCTATSAPVSITVLAAPTAVITANGPLTFCEGGSVNLTASGGSMYHWSTGANTPVISVTDAGTYTVSIVGANGCTDTEQTTVTVNAVPSANVVMDGNSVLCPGESLTLTAAPGNTYAWTTGSNANEITVSAAGNYGVTVTAPNGCTANSGNIVVTAGQSSASTLDVVAFDSYTLNGIEYSTSGTFTQVIQNEVGCDSTITLNLTLTVGVDELTGVAYEVYPNPTADQFTIDASQAVYGNYSIQDAQGKLVKEGIMNGVSTTVDLNQVARGIYFLRIADKSEAIRIIKN
ncbi:MAG: GEVED domain-containing protein, partial [Flavobacteriales bacterium]